MDIWRRLFDCVRRARLPVAALLATLALHPAVAGGDFSRGLLWRVDVGTAAPSYLFGTIHAEDARVVTLAQPVQAAFDESRQVVLELVLDGETLVAASVAMLLTDGRTLKDIVGQDLYAKTLVALEAYAVPEPVAARLKPWAVATTLVMPKPVTGIVLDSALYQAALAAGKPVEGLESAEEQLRVFDDLEERHQITMLRDAVDHAAENRVEFDALLDAWLERDLAGMIGLGDTSLQRVDDEFVETFERTLILERNHRMDERLQPYLKAGGAFIAVGALHLPGDDGLLRLLEQRGYRITRVW